MVIKTPKKKKVTKEKAPKKTEVPVEKKKKSIVARKKESPFVVAPIGSELWRAFDDIFESFRSDFEDLLFPSPWTSTYPAFPEIRVPLIDLQDRGRDYLLKAEMPGFKKRILKSKFKRTRWKLRVEWDGNMIRKQKAMFAKRELANRLIELCSYLKR